MGAALGWVNTGAGSNASNTFKTSADAKANSGLVTCGKSTYKTKVVSAGTYIKAAVGTYAAKTPVAACAAGAISLTVRNWENTNSATKYGLDYLCLALS